MKRNLNGVLMLDKACGASSNAVLQQVKRLYQAAKAGHGGTLDPLATGLLPIMFGEATKFSADLITADKSYAAQIKLGISTTTDDAEGEAVATHAVCVTPQQLTAALAKFRGAVTQIPPVFSALKYAGKPLYAYARSGVDIERAPRQVTISKLELDWFEDAQLSLSLTCSKGTYVRSLARDLGETLGCGAHLIALRRTRVGGFRLDCAQTLESLAAMSMTERDSRLLPVDALLQNLPEVHLEPAQQASFVRGRAVLCNVTQQARVRVYGPGCTLLGVGEANPDGTVSPKRVIAGT